ncbi:MAG: hypothetical protein AAGI23_08560 [Bacteroidota bacterium]
MNTYNTHLAAAIETHFGGKKEALPYLMNALNLNRNAIYKRLSGKTPFTFEQIGQIASDLNISLDQIIQINTNRVYCETNFYDNNKRSFYHFLKDICDQFEQIAKLPDGKLYYATRGLPLFLYLDEPELLAFKLYVWDIGSWNKERIHDRKFSFNLLSDKERELAKRIYELYCQIPTYEIWNNSILESSLEQIQYLREVQLFEDENMIHQLAESMYRSIQKAKDWATVGNKSEQAEFHLYHVELFNSTNNVIYFESELSRMVSWTFCDPDYIASTDDVLCDRALQWLNQLMEQANPVSNRAFRLRSSYFEQLKDYFQFEGERLVI